MHEDERRIYAAGKRLSDVLVALLALLLLAPIWITAVVLVKLTSRGSVLYRQSRCGRDGTLFTCFKFRTMFDGADGQLA